jgi:hypothetical protein
MPHRKCLRYTLTLTFVTLRLILAVLYTFWFLPRFIYLFLYAMELQKLNMWHSKSEPFFTNCSPFNALIAWILWVSFEITYYVFSFYALLLLLGVAILLVKILTGNSRETCLICGFIIEILRDVWISYLFAKQA